MPQPTVSQVHIDRILTHISVAYIQDENNFIASKVFPRVPVEKKSDLFWKYTKNDWFRDEAKPRASLTESAGGGYNLTTDSYTAEVYAYHKDVGPQERANADAPIDMDRDATLFVTQKILLRQELQWVTDFFGTGIWGTDITPTLWDNYATSDPIGDIRTGMATVLGTTGYEPNTLVLGYQVYQKLIDHPDIVDRIKYGSSSAENPALVNEQTLAKIFGLKRVLVARAIKATNNEGAAEAYAFALGKSALLAYSADSPSLMAPSAGYQFWWRGIAGGMGTPSVVYRIPIPLLGLGAERIEAEMAFANKKVAADLGYMFNSVVS